LAHLSSPVPIREQVQPICVDEFSANANLNHTVINEFGKMYRLEWIRDTRAESLAYNIKQINISSLSKSIMEPYVGGVQRIIDPSGRYKNDCR